MVMEAEGAAATEVAAAAEVAEVAVVAVVVVRAAVVVVVVEMVVMAEVVRVVLYCQRIYNRHYHTLRQCSHLKSRHGMM